MDITTKFTLGDSVVFLQDETLYRRQIRSIEILVQWHENVPTSVITYYFLNMESRGNSEVYKYEHEVATTKEELIAKLKEH